VSDDDQLFRFVQFEFPWIIGPDPGRYVLRAPGATEPAFVLVVATLGAAQRRRLGAKRARDAEPEPEPVPVATTRATAIAATPLDGSTAAIAWMAATRRAPAPVIADAIAAVNRAIHAHRVAAADGAIREVSRDRAIALRIGYGRGEQVADGRWSEAADIPAPHGPRKRRSAALRPQERLAAMLGGREHPLACEELTLRARTDVEAGRLREAAIQLRAALVAAIGELEASPGGAPDMGQRIAELRGLRPAIDEAADEAIGGVFAAPERERVVTTLERLEAALRARSAAGPVESAGGAGESAAGPVESAGGAGGEVAP